MVACVSGHSECEISALNFVSAFTKMLKKQQHSTGSREIEFLL